MRSKIALCFTLTALMWLPLPGAETTATAVAAPSAAADNPDHLAIGRNLQTAEWMLKYDRTAWGTSDLLPKEDKETLLKVSAVWFCLEQDGVAYALYGQVQSNAFAVALCYRQVSEGKFAKVSPLEFPDKDRFARAIALTLPEIQEFTRRTTVRFNYYIRNEADKIAVYYLPAFQTDGRLAYGIQHTYFLDASGDKILSEEKHGQILRGAIPDKNTTITLEMTESSVPTPQAMFTMMSFRHHFADILTHCRDGYFGMTMRDGVPVCVQTSAPPPNPQGRLP